MTTSRKSFLMTLVILSWVCVGFVTVAWAGEAEVLDLQIKSLDTVISQWSRDIKNNQVYIISVKPKFKPPFGQVRAINIKGVPRSFWVADKRKFDEELSRKKEMRDYKGYDAYLNARNKDGRNRVKLTEEIREREREKLDLQTKLAKITGKPVPEEIVRARAKELKQLINGLGKTWKKQAAKKNLRYPADIDYEIAHFLYPRADKYAREDTTYIAYKEYLIKITEAYSKARNGEELGQLINSLKQQYRKILL